MTIYTIRDELDTISSGMADALLNRLTPAVKLSDNGRQYRSLSVLGMAREMLELCGVNVRGMDKMTLAATALSYRAFRAGGTPDFPAILSNVANKRLRLAYEENPGTYALWARRGPDAPDFRNLSVVQVSGMPELLRVAEHGEFKYGTVSDGVENYSLLTYGRILQLTRQALVNDDLRAFDVAIAGFGSAAKRLENRLVYAQLTANSNLTDGMPLFAPGHNNLAAGGDTALQATSLAAARTAMRLQKGLQSEELNISPEFLIVPACLEQTAYQLTSANYVPARQQDTNEFRAGGRTALTPIVEPILDSISSTAWYAAASCRQVDTIEYCYLDGADGPIIESQPGFHADGMNVKCRLDFAAKAIDFRGLYKAAGI